MRDAFGGSFMIKLLIVFIVLYVSFTAIALNYAKAFKVKNKVIQYIEDNEISDISNMSARDDMELKRYINETIIEGMNYNVTTVNCPKNDVPSYCMKFHCENGIEISECKTDKKDSNKEGVYYIVSTTFGWNIPFLNVLLRLNNQEGSNTSGLWKISGETRTIISEGK